MITDAIVLIAVSQLVCLGAIGYLAMQVHSLHRAASARVPGIEKLSRSERGGRGGQAPMELVRRSAVSAYANGGVPQPARGRQAQASEAMTPAKIPMHTPIHDAREIVEKMAQLGVDVPTLARRVGRSEEEIRLILRRHTGAGTGAPRATGGAI